jgi:PAS domain S-box-containing protein
MTKHEIGMEKILRRRYILALSIIACLVILSQLAIQFSISKNEDDSRIINIAGRQRMLSQRITKCVLGMYITEDPAKKAPYLEKLIKSTELWEVSHKGLQHGNAEMGLPGRNSPEIRELFARIQDRHLKILKAAKSIAALAADKNADKDLIKKEIQVITENEGEFLKGMDTIVFQYDNEAKAKVKLVKHVEITLAIITLFVLVMEALYIFRPAELQIKSKISKIRENEKSIKRIFETAPIAMFLVDRTNLEIMRLNHLAASMLNVDADSATGKNFKSLWGGCFDKNKELCDRMKGETVISNEEVEINLEGRKKSSLLVSSSHMVYGDAPAIIIGLSDVSRQRELEQQLRQSQKMDAMGQLAGGIAHDFNNLLTGIIGNISLLKMLSDPGNKKLTDRLLAAETAADRARELTQRILTFSRGGAPVKKTFSLAKLVKESSSLALSGANAVCEYVIPDDLWPVYADDGQIGQVIGNLVINAHQAMPNCGRITIQCENARITDKEAPIGCHGRFVKMSITDEGIGIPVENLTRIFDPFFTTKENGQGLGLAISYSIIKNHDGLISVESEEGGGTTFTISLPASESVVACADAETDRHAFGTGRVLLMDDEEIIRETAREILQHIGYKVELANDGNRAIEMYENALRSGTPFDAVIMDLTIPGGMGGKDAVLHLREIDPHVRAIVSSGYSNDPIMADCRHYGFDEVVSKPYNVGELSRKLFDVINGCKHA